MNTTMYTRRSLLLGLTALGLLLGVTQFASAQQPGYEIYGHYPDYATAARIAAAIRGGNDSRYDNAYAEQRANPVTRTYGVYAHIRQSGGPGQNYSGALSKGHPLDRVRRQSHAVAYPMQLTAGRQYTIDLRSPQGAQFFDTWLRVEGNGFERSDDDSGGGYNSRLVFSVPRTGTYNVVVTSYRAGATGAYTLTVR